MASIGWITWPEHGHLVPTLGIARRLQHLGHRVIFLGVQDVEERIRQEGLEFVVVMQEVFPRGSLNGNIESQTSVMQAFKKARATVRHYRRMLAGTDLQPILNKMKIDFMIVDSLLPTLALIARSNGIPSALCSVTFPQRKEPGVPPLTTDIIPDEKLLTKVKTEWAWRKHLAVRSTGRNIGSALGLSVNTDRFLQSLARKTGFDSKKIEFRTMFEPVPDIPEFVICPAELDFPRPTRDGRYFVGPSIHHTNRCIQFPWERLHAEKVLIYCTLGSQSHQYRQSVSFFQALIDAVRQKPEWQLVVSIGEHLPIDSFHDVPQNVIVVRWAPETEVLKRAALMINHAGLGTIQNCIYFGVPMILFPIFRDQPGNAARVVYHGMGVRGEIRKATPNSLTEMISTVLATPSMKANAGSMGRRFRELEAEHVGANCIESLVAASLRASEYLHR